MFSSTSSILVLHVAASLLSAQALTIPRRREDFGFRSLTFEARRSARLTSPVLLHAKRSLVNVGNDYNLEVRYSCYLQNNVAHEVGQYVVNITVGGQGNR